MSTRVAVSPVSGGAGGMAEVLLRLARGDQVSWNEAARAARYFEQARAIGGPHTGGPALWELAAKLASDDAGD